MRFEQQTYINSNFPCPSWTCPLADVLAEYPLSNPAYGCASAFRTRLRVDPGATLCTSNSRRSSSFFFVYIVYRRG